VEPQNVAHFSWRTAGQGRETVPDRLSEDNAKLDAMLLEDLRNRLVRHLAAVKPLCHEYEHRALSDRVAQFLEPQPASDTSLGSPGRDPARRPDSPRPMRGNRTLDVSPGPVMAGTGNRWQREVMIIRKLLIPYGFLIR
jgi:hypothetical protein